MQPSCGTSRSLLLACIFLAVCSAQCAAAAHSSSSRSLQQSMPSSGTTVQGKKRVMSTSEIMSIAASTGALLPACVPKYVTDLVLPPPMPVTTQPLSEATSRRRKEAGGRSLLEADASEPAKADRRGRLMADPEQASANAEETVVKPVKKTREVYDIDDDYWNAIYNEPKKVDKKKKSSVEEDSAPGDGAPTPQEVDANANMPAYTGYDISVRQISQDVLPQAPHAPNQLPGCPANFRQTDVLAYGPANVPGTPFHNWPAYTIEAQHSYETRVRWTNDLIDSHGNFIPHMLRESIDQTLTWANPGALGGETDRSACAECKKAGPGGCEKDQFCLIASSTTYNGPVPIVTHLHGQSSVTDFSDGYPEAWFLPKAKNLLAYKNVGGWYQAFKREYAALTGNRWNQGTSTSIYKNAERPSMQWFHDNTLGIARLNVYSGLSGFYFVRERFPSLANGPELPGLPYPAYDGTIDPMLVRELPLAIQDRAFTNESQLWYPVADHPGNNSLPAGAVPPRSLPEFSASVFANGVPVNMVMMTVNGKTYPRQAVHPDAYRLRILNACNTRTMQLRFARSSKSQINPLTSLDLATLLPMYVVGNEGGFLPQVQPPMTTLQVGPAERYDVVVDFSGLMPGEYVYLLNNGPEPDTALYDGANNGVGLTEHTAQIMRFDVVSMPPELKARPFTADEQCSLNQAMKAHYTATATALDKTAPFNVKRLALLDQAAADGTPVVLQMGTADANRATVTPWTEPVSMSVPLNTTQYWDIINLSPDAVPVHLHNTAFRFVGRWRVETDPTTTPRVFEDSDVPVTNPDLDQLLQVQCSFDPSGRCAVARDTMLMLPSTRTRIAFNGPATQGLFTWNAQVLEAQDNEMQAPWCIGTPHYVDPRRPGQRMCPGISASK